VIIANTKRGTGVASIEGDFRWHGKAPSSEQAASFIKELKDHE
jgi:transketolase